MSTEQQRDVLRQGFEQLGDLEPTSYDEVRRATRFETVAPLINPTEAELNYAFAANLFDLFRSMSHLPGAVLEENDTFSRHLSQPFNPMFKGIWNTRLAGDQVAEAIADSVAWLRGHDAPFAFWWVDPLATPPGLAQQLLAHDFVAWEVDAPGMTARMSDLRFALLDSTPAGYEQERVTDERGLLDFMKAFVTGFEVPEWAGQAWVEATLAFGIEDAPWSCYVGRLDGEPVASNMLFNGAGVASVFGVATVPEARGQGIGAAITLAAYRDALELGYEHAVLFGTESGSPVYRRIGFHDVGATISRYLWRS